MALNSVVLLGALSVSKCQKLEFVRCGVKQA